MAKAQRAQIVVGAVAAAVMVGIVGIWAYIRHRARRPQAVLARVQALAAEVVATERAVQVFRPMGSEATYVYPEGYEKRREALCASLGNEVLPLLAHPEPEARLGALDLLRAQGGWGTEGAFASVRGALGDADARVRSAAAGVLASLGWRARDGVPNLTFALDDEDPRVQVAAARALRDITPPDVRLLRGDCDPLEPRYREWTTYPTLVQDYRVLFAPAARPLARGLRNPNAEVRKSCGEVLSRLGPAAHEALPELREALRQEDPQAVYWAAFVIGNLGAAGEPAVGDLVRALPRPDESLRCGLLRSLGAIGPKASSALPALRDLAAGPEGEVKSCAQSALQAIEE